MVTNIGDQDGGHQVL